MAAFSHNHRDSAQQGRRAEKVANWYFRLNGFLQIPSFVLHSDRSREAITDADLLGVRFPYSRETLRGIGMADDRWIVNAMHPGQTLFTIVEVKKSTCNVNGPWTDPKRGGMEKVIRRIGFAPDDLTAEISKSLYDTLQWKNDEFLVQYVAVGKTPNHELARRYPKLRQLTWREIAAFLFERFRDFGQVKGSHGQWPHFGRQFAQALFHGRLQHIEQAATFVEGYIENRVTEQSQ